MAKLALEPKELPIDALPLQKIMELARARDQELAEIRQDLVRSERNLKAERRWKWVDRICSGFVGMVIVIAVLHSGIIGFSGEAYVRDWPAVASFLNFRVWIGSVSVSVAGLLGLLAIAAAAFLLLAIAMRRPSPRAAARAILKRARTTEAKLRRMHKPEAPASSRRPAPPPLEGRSFAASGVSMENAINTLLRNVVSQAAR